MRQQIVREFPPVYSKLIGKFPIEGNKGVIFSWGGIIYNPYSIYIPPHLIVHEAVHGLRQIDQGIENWWDNYISDDQFRFDEELQAHVAEYLALVGDNANRPIRRRAMKQVTKRLCGPLYGKMSSLDKAKRLILDELQEASST